MSDGLDIATRFNALRFMAMSLKSQNETLKGENVIQEDDLAR